MSAAAILAFAIPYDDIVERGRDQVLTMWGSRNGSVVAPDAGTISIYRPDNTALVEDQVVAITTAGVAEYTLLGTDLDSEEPLGEGWREEWTLEYDGEASARIVRRPMAVARRALVPVIGIAELEAEYPGLELLVRKSVSPAEPVYLQGFIDNAWARILRRLIGDGVCTYKMFDPSFAADMHQQMALYLATKHLYRCQGSSTQNRWQELYREHLAEYNGAYNRWTSTVDADHDGVVDGQERQSSNAAVLHVNAASPTPPRSPRAETRW